MRTKKPRVALILIFLCLVISSCNPSATQVSDSTTTSSALTSPGFSVIWPTNNEDCIASLPAPTLALCFPDDIPLSIKVSLPAALVPGVEEAVLGSLPGGAWSSPVPLSLNGSPEFGIGQAGIVIINDTPAPDAAAAGIIIINDTEGQAGIIIVNTFPQPGTAEGIIVVDSKPSGESGVGLVELSIPSLEPGQMVGDQALSGQILSLNWLEPLEAAQQLTEGIVWGSLVANATEDFVNASPLITGFEWGVPPDDGMTAIVWGGLTADAFGIIIINNLPGPDQGAEGLIIVNGKDISQVMGIIMEDKPGAEDGSEGIVIVDSKPAEFNAPGISGDAVVYTSLPDTDTSSEGIIIVGGKPAVSQNGTALSNFGLPAGFGLPEGMMPFLGDTGYGPGPFTMLSLDLAYFEASSNQGNCYQIALSELTGAPSSGASFAADSFFEVFTNLTVGIPQEGTDTGLITKVVPLRIPDYAFCTPEPGSISDDPGVDPALPTGTASTSPLPPTATTRTGLPTTTPTPLSRLPTDTPAPGRGD